MALLPIITAPDPRLKLVSTPVARVDDEVRRLIDDMLETMYAAPGIGLSAVQVGVTKRVIVIDVGHTVAERAPLCLVNPEIVWRADTAEFREEGCLSFPDHFAEVRRSTEVTVGYLDANGEACEKRADGVLATCIQHEIDHLEGILFVDHLSAVRRSIIVRKLMKTRKTKAPKSA